jgi:hypothetical protein
VALGLDSKHQNNRRYTNGISSKEFDRVKSADSSLIDRHRATGARNGRQPSEGHQQPPQREPDEVPEAFPAHDESVVPSSCAIVEREDDAALYAGSIANRKALVVNDDPRNLYAMRMLLERYQMEVLQAENGREALRLIEQHPALAVVLMDTNDN